MSYQHLDRETLAKVALTLLALGLIAAFSGCTQAFVEVRHDRASRLDKPPDTVLSVGARWYFWDAYGDWLANKVKEAQK